VTVKTIRRGAGTAKGENPSVVAVPSSLAGHLHLEASLRDDGRTVLARQSFCVPFHISKPYWDGRALQVQIVNPTAGILAGDHLELAARVNPGAVLIVTTPAATRAFMMRSGVAECRQLFTVGTGGWLEYAPEPLCPHRDSDYAQTTRVDLAAGAEAFYVDTLAPGRVGLGERWAWRRLQLTLEIALGGEPVLRERLAGSGADMARLAAFYGTNAAWFATAVIISSRLTADDPAWECVRALHGGGRWLGVTRLRRGGWIVRAIAPDGQALRDTLAELRRILAEKLPLLQSDLRKL
jgi:urease accessory protein